MDTRFPLGGLKAMSRLLLVFTPRGAGRSNRWISGSASRASAITSPLPVTVGWELKRIDLGEALGRALERCTDFWFCHVYSLLAPRLRPMLRRNLPNDSQLNLTSF
jgi:hypothetical protein